MIEELLTLIEKNKSQLTKIDDDLYHKINERIRELEEKKGIDEKVDDEVRTLKRLRRKIFELRTGKIINAAWAEVCGQEVGLNKFSRKDFFQNIG